MRTQLQYYFIPVAPPGFFIETERDACSENVRERWPNHLPMGTSLNSIARVRMARCGYGITLEGTDAGYDSLAGIFTSRYHACFCSIGEVSKNSIPSIASRSFNCLWPLTQRLTTIPQLRNPKVLLHFYDGACLTLDTFPQKSFPFNNFRTSDLLLHPSIRS